MSMIPTEEELYQKARLLPGGERDFGGLTVDNEWRTLYEYEPTGDEGFPSRVDVMRLPSQCHRLVTEDVEITTGSGPEMGVLMCKIAEDVASGMVRLRSRR
jgi:hypothetical protein